MPLEFPFVVKVCGITNEQDARTAVEAGANALGFNFYPRSPRYIAPEHAHDIARAVPGAYLRVGVFVNAGIDELTAAAHAVPLDVLQLHGESVALPATRQYRVWRSIPGNSAPPPGNEQIEAYLLDNVTPSYGGSGRPFDWAGAAGFPFRAIVAGGLDAANVAAAIATLRPWGVDACSLLESRPGVKDPARVQAFVHAAFEASRSMLREMTL